MTKDNSTTLQEDYNDYSIKEFSEIKSNTGIDCEHNHVIDKHVDINLHFKGICARCKQELVYLENYFSINTELNDIQLEILNSLPLTSSDISEKFDLGLTSVYTYLSRLSRFGLIETTRMIETNGAYKIYRRWDQ